MKKISPQGGTAVSVTPSHRAQAVEGSTAVSHDGDCVPTIAVVGLGPRGISIVERLAAALPAESVCTLVLIDDAQHGAGKVWDTQQTPTVCMNTLAGAVTLFCEPHSSVQVPVLQGPTMYEWLQVLRGEPVPAHAQRACSLVPPTMPKAYAKEVVEAVPWSHPSRALYGEYLR